MSKGIMIVLVALITLFLGVSFFLAGYWQKSGPVFNMPIPEAIVVERVNVAPQQIQFPNIFPGRFYTLLDSKPALKIGDVLEIDMSSKKSQIEHSEDNYLRVQSEVAKNVYHTFFLYTDKPSSGKSPLKLKVIGLRECNVVTQQNEVRWYWLRQAYDVVVL
jgi:hypothetical protein